MNREAKSPEELMEWIAAGAKPKKSPSVLVARDELDKKIRKAVEADFQQWMIQSLTPDRGYMTPIDNVKALILALISQKK